MNNKYEVNRLATALLLASGLSAINGSGHAAVVGSQTGSSISLSDGTTLIADQLSGGGLYGIIIPKATTGTADLGSGSTVSVTDADRLAQGIILQSDNSRLTADKLTLNVSGKTATGIELTGTNASADLGSGSSVSTVGTGDGFADGITISNASSLIADQLQISTQGKSGVALHVSGYGSQADLGDSSVIQTNGTTSHGIRVDALSGLASDGLSSLTANHLTIHTLGKSSQGINIQENSAVDLGSNSTIITAGDTSAGIWSLGNLTADHLTIGTSGTTSAGLTVRGNGEATIGKGSVISTAQSGGIVAMGDSAMVNFTGSEEERNRVQSSGSFAISAQSPGSTINLQNTDIAVNTTGSLGLGLWAMGGTINGEGLAITGAADSTIGIYAMTEGVVKLQDGLTIDMGSPEGVAIATQHDDGYAASVITADGKMNITGSIQSLGGLIDLNFTSGSLWSGSAVSDKVNGGHLNVNLTDSEWRVASSSTVDNLQLSQSLVDLTAASDTNAYSTLTVANLSGSGDFALRTDIVGEGEGLNNDGDKIVVTDSSAGVYRLTIQNSGSAVTTGNEVLTVVETPDGIATFTGNSDVELGGYVYTVNQQGTNWVLSSAKTDDSNADVTPLPTDPATAPATASDAEGEPASSADTAMPETATDSGRTPVISSAANAGAQFLNAGYLMSYAEMQTLMQRMGDVRQGKTAGNVWLRGVDGRFSGFANGRLSDFSMNYSGYQFGVDKRLSEQLPLYVGLFMGMTEGSPHYTGGSGTTKSEHFGLYGTWQNDEGYYLDGVMKFNRLRNQFSVRDTQNNAVSGYGVSSGMSVSLEAGKKISLSENGAGFYLEPQLQLTAGHQDGSSMRASNGLKIDLSNYKTLQGRATLLAGYEINHNDYKLNTYIKSGVTREFLGNAAYALNGSIEKLSFKGNGWNNGVGVSAQVSNHTLFLEADRLDGQRFNQRQFNAGYRFSF